MGSQFFPRAVNTRFGHNTIFQHVEGDVNHNYFNHTSSLKQEEDRIMPRQNEFREFLKGDIYLQEQTFSEETELVIRIPSRDNCLYQRDLGRRVKVTKKFHTATIFPHIDQKFTVVTFEPKDKRNKETMRLLWKAAYEAYSRYKSPQLMQMLGLMTSEMPAFIIHQGSDSYFSRPQSNADQDTQSWSMDGSCLLGIKETESYYTTSVTPETLHLKDSAPIKLCQMRTGTWQYDTSTSQPYGRLLPNMITSLPLQGLNPELNAKEIIACFEQTFGPSRIDWSLHEAHGTQLVLAFSLCVPLHERIRLRMAYLCQSHPVLACNPSLEHNGVAFIDCIEFTLFGDFLYDPTTGPTPAYLFVPHFWVDIIDGMFCTYFPPLETLFYWASDPNGINKIPEKDWERYRIPRLRVQPLCGSTWETYSYDFVQDQLRRKGYGEDGAQYARDHGYAELILGDPRDVGRIEEL
ncbi:hypothetical protein PQX77_014456 [Marasmius sp. AFHP31]|nr:hypothetical protein PQX77_014456 [Marasmius sp. AFHP31]